MTSTQPRPLIGCYVTTTSISMTALEAPFVRTSTLTLGVVVAWTHQALAPAGVMPDLWGMSLQEAGIEESILRGVEP